MDSPTGGVVQTGTVAGLRDGDQYAMPNPPYFRFFLPHRAAAAFLAIATRFLGERASFLASPRLTAAWLGMGFSFGILSVAMSTIICAISAVSRGRFGFFILSR